MKFCSVGAAKYKIERSGCNSIQYLFDTKTKKPTDAQSFLDIINDARSISVDITDKVLTCSAMAGFKDNKLFLTSITVGPRTFESSANAAGIINVADTPNLFYQFCCVKTFQSTNNNTTNGDRTYLDIDTIKLDTPPLKYSPLAFYTKNNIQGYKMVLYPNRLKSYASNLSTKMGYSTSNAQTLSSYSQSSYEYFINPYAGWRTAYRTTQYVTYIGNVRFDLGTKKAYAAGIACSSIPAGTVYLNFSSASIAGIQLVCPNKLYSYYDSGSGASSSYYQAGMVVANNITTISELVKTPYIELSGVNETVDLGFSVIGYRDIDKDNIVIRDFSTDLTQTATGIPGEYPQVILNTPLPEVETVWKL